MAADSVSFRMLSGSAIDVDLNGVSDVRVARLRIARALGCWSGRITLNAGAAVLQDADDFPECATYRNANEILVIVDSAGLEERRKERKAGEAWIWEYWHQGKQVVKLVCPYERGSGAGVCYTDGSKVWHWDVNLIKEAKFFGFRFVAKTHSGSHWSQRCEFVAPGMAGMRGFGIFESKDRWTAYHLRRWYAAGPRGGPYKQIELALIDFKYGLREPPKIPRSYWASIDDNYHEHLKELLAFDKEEGQA